MAVTAKMYASSMANFYGSSASGGSPMAWSPSSDTIKCELCTISHTISQAHTVKGDLTNEASGTGYTAGGATLTSLSQNTASLTMSFDADDVSWTTATFSAASAHLYDDTIATPVKPLISYVDFGGTQTVTAGTLTIIWNASGVWSITVA